MEPQRVLEFWLEECSPQDWYISSDELDQKIRDEFLQVWSDAKRGSYGSWLTSANGALAYLILTDQFPRNMFRGDGQAFASDKLGLAAAKKAIQQKWDRKIDAPAKQFFYMPLMHSENLCDQDRCVRLVQERLDSPSTLLHARAHREIIRKFGRFPYRNAALKRQNTKDETEFLANDSYGDVVKRLDKACA